MNRGFLSTYRNTLKDLALVLTITAIIQTFIKK